MSPKTKPAQVPLGGRVSSLMTEALFFYNPRAGRRPPSGERVEHLVGLFRREGINCTPMASQPGVSPCPAVDLSNQELVIVCGGDGTIHQALQFAVPAKRKIAILPAGTVNVLARELGLPMRLDEAVKVAADGRIKRIRLGEAGGRYFHLMAGVGLDGVIIENVSHRLKEAFGAGAYWISGILSLWKYVLDPFPVIVDGEGYEATFAVIANARNYGGQLVLAPAADLEDPYLDVCLFTSRSRRRYVRYLLAAFKGNHVSFPDVTYRKARSVDIPATRDLPVQMDGDVVARLPVSIRIYDPGVDVVVPA